MTTTAIDPSQPTGSAGEAAPVGRIQTGDIVCRLLDASVSLILLTALMPLMLVIGVIIRLTSTGPALFRQRRLGRDLVPFTVHKFRTMHNGVSSDVHRAFVLSLIAGDEPEHTAREPQFKLADDARVTSVGRFLRRSSLDELPQLWDVLRGKMSLVGPRPAISYEVENYPEDWFTRFSVRPGITGLWQVSGRSELTMKDMVRLDIEYAHRRSVRLNVWILLRTIPAVLTTRGAS